MIVAMRNEPRGWAGKSALESNLSNQPHRKPRGWAGESAPESVLSNRLPRKQIISFRSHATNAEPLRVGVSAQRHPHYLLEGVALSPYSSFCLLHTSRDMPAIAAVLLSPTYRMLPAAYFASFHDLFTITGGAVCLKLTGAR